MRGSSAQVGQQRATPPCQRPQPSPGPPLRASERWVPPSCGLKWEGGYPLGERDGCAAGGQQRRRVGWTWARRARVCKKDPAVQEESGLCKDKKGTAEAERAVVSISGLLRHWDLLLQGGGYSLRLRHLLPSQLPVKDKAESPCPPTLYLSRLHLQDRACLCNSAVILSARGRARVVRAMLS